MDPKKLCVRQRLSTANRETGRGKLGSHPPQPRCPNGTRLGGERVDSSEGNHHIDHHLGRERERAAHLLAHGVSAGSLVRRGGRGRRRWGDARGGRTAGLAGNRRPARQGE